MRKHLILSACIILGATAAHAQYSGPGGTAAAPAQTAAPAAPAATGQVVTVASILVAPQDDQLVVLEGVLLRKLGKEDYQFSDGTGEIKVEIDDKKFPAGQVNESTRLRIEGEVDVSASKPVEIDAKRVTILP